MFRDKGKWVTNLDAKYLHDTGVLLTKLSKTTIHKYKRFSKVAVEGEDISVCGLQILTSLRYYPERNTISDIAQTLEVSKGLISRNVEDLRKNGYVDTYQDSVDRRVLRITINDEKSQSVLLKQKKNLFKLIYQMAEGISDEQIIEFNKVLEVLLDNCKDASLDKDCDLPDIDYKQFVF